MKAVLELVFSVAIFIFFQSRLQYSVHVLGFFIFVANSWCVFERIVSLVIQVHIFGIYIYNTLLRLEVHCTVFVF